MRVTPPHDFRQQREHRVEQPAHAFLALVDLDTYPAYLSRQADRLDLLQHLCAQRQALTAAMWEVPEARWSLDLIWTADDRPGERLRHTGHRSVADESVRTGGSLLLTGDDWLLHGAHDRRDDLLQGRGSEVQQNVHLLNLPAGVYAVSVFSGTTMDAGANRKRESAFGYTVILRHYPNPAPRLQPVRINHHLSFASDGPLDHADAAPDSHDSHKMPR